MTSNELQGPQTPNNNAKKRKPHPGKDTPGSSGQTSSSGPKLTPNNHNIRESLAEQGMRFEDLASYEKYPTLQTFVEQIVFAERGSSMKAESAQRIRKWRQENKTTDELTYFTELKEMIIKKGREKETTFAGEVQWVYKSFDDDEMVWKANCIFTRGVLPKAVEEAEKRLGLTNPQPNHVYGIKKPQWADPINKSLSEQVKAFIGVVPGIHHPWFAIENKSSQDPIEDAETQAIRSGAAMVRALRELKKRAAAKTTLEKSGIIDSTVSAQGRDEPIRQPEDPSELQEQTALNLPTKLEGERPGPDFDCLAFTCSWVPQMANIHVHWYELLEDGESLWYMNVLRGYLFLAKDDMKHFRADVHNILDWGITEKRKQGLRDMIKAIAANGG